jgi:quinol monooxygenase YgiN
MIHVIAVITTVPGKRAELIGAICANTPAVRAEEGCIEYGAVVDASEPAPLWRAFGSDTVVIIEKWESRAALKRHAAAPHMAAYAAEVKDIIAERVIHVLEPASAGCRVPSPLQGDG